MSADIEFHTDSGLNSLVSLAVAFAKAPDSALARQALAQALEQTSQRIEQGRLGLDELHKLVAAAAPFGDAFERSHAPSYMASPEFTAELDANTALPKVLIGDFRRLNEALRSARLVDEAHFVETIDLMQLEMQSLIEAAEESKWMPPEYSMNDWLSDVRMFLMEGPAYFSSRRGPRPAAAAPHETAHVDIAT